MGEAYNWVVSICLKSKTTCDLSLNHHQSPKMPGHENWTIVSFPDHYYHLLLPKAVTDADSAYYKGKHGAEITGLNSLRSVWNYPIRAPVASRWDAFKWRSNLTAPSKDLFFNIVDRTDNSVHRVRRRYRYYVKNWGAALVKTESSRQAFSSKIATKYSSFRHSGCKKKSLRSCFLLFCFTCKLKGK